jgi:hypothetical protein
VFQFVDISGRDSDNDAALDAGREFFLIMRKAVRYASTSALPAIAAVLALISAPALAQEVVPAQPAPTTTEPAPVTVDTPLAPETSVPPIEDTTESAPVVSTTTEAPAPKAKPRTVAKAAPKPVAAKTVVRSAQPAAPAAPAAPKPVRQANSESAVTPIVDTRAAAPDTSAPAKPADASDNRMAMELGGGALALLALGAGAFALSRRQRHEEEGEYIDEGYEHEPMAEVKPEPMPQHDPIFDEQPAIVAPPASAFAWGNGPAAGTAEDDDGSDRRPGETWVERAYRGPSPANPSVSLRNRLRRAAFFDKRERDVEAGKAEPVDSDAGLPDAMVEEQERELA